MRFAQPEIKGGWSLRFAASLTWDRSCLATCPARAFYDYDFWQRLFAPANFLGQSDGAGGFIATLQSTFDDFCPENERGVQSPKGRFQPSSGLLRSTLRLRFPIVVLNAVVFLRVEKLPSGKIWAGVDRACIFGTQGPDPNKK
eukprot:s3090_g8.t1